MPAIFGPAASAWYGVLQRHVVFKSTTATVVARVIADQTIFTPAHLFCFLSSMSILEGTDPWEKLRKSYWPTYKTNLGVWSTVQLANFSLVPLEYRVLVVNVVSLGKSASLLRIPPHAQRMSIVDNPSCRLELLLELRQQQLLNSINSRCIFFVVFKGWLIDIDRSLFSMAVLVGGLSVFYSVHSIDLRSALILLPSEIQMDPFIFSFY